MDDEVRTALVALLQDRRRLAKAMLDAFAANAFEKSPIPEDVAHWQVELAECDAELRKYADA